MNDLTIIIPFLNENKILPSLIKSLRNYPLTINYIFCDGGSLDGSMDLLNKLLDELPIRFFGLKTSKKLSVKLNNPSIMKTIRLAKNEVSSKYILIHPVDIDCSSLFEDLRLEKDYYHFCKVYYPSNSILKIQSFLLNNFRSKIMNQFVWTNAPLMKSELYQEILQFDVGFLEDILSSDYLRKSYQGKCISKYVKVSSRRYLQNTPIKRIMRIFFIMICYRLGLKNISKLKEIYLKE